MPIEHIHHHYHHKAMKDSAISIQDIEESRKNRIKTKKMADKELKEWVDKKKNRDRKTV